MLWGPEVEGDIRDKAALLSAVKRYEPIAVMHFAALALVGESVAHPERYWDVNVRGTWTLLEVMRECALDKLIFSSTCAVYGEPDQVPIGENTSKNPVNPYGATKLTAEQMMDDFGKAHGLSSVRLRYFNAAGADPEGEIGEHHVHESHLIPLVLDTAMGRREAIDIYGQDYPTSDGTAIRDYIHVVDLAAAHLKALNYLLVGGSTLAVNLGTGKGASVEEVVTAAERATNQRIARRAAPRRNGDPARLVAKPRLAWETLGWQAKRSDLETIIADSWHWHQQRFNSEVVAVGVR